MCRFPLKGDVGLCLEGGCEGRGAVRNSPRSGEWQSIGKGALWWRCRLWGPSATIYNMCYTIPRVLEWGQRNCCLWCRVFCLVICCRCEVWKFPTLSNRIHTIRIYVVLTHEMPTYIMCMYVRTLFELFGRFATRRRVFPTLPVITWSCVCRGR